MLKITKENILDSDTNIFGSWIKDDNIKNKYNNNPFGHIIIDNFLNDEYVEEVFNNLPDDYETWWKYNNPLEVKFANDKINDWDVLRIVRTQLRLIELQSINEIDLDDVKLPGNIERFINKLIDQIKKVNLTKPRQYAIVGRIVMAMGLDVNKLSQMMSIIRKDMKK